MKAWLQGVEDWIEQYPWFDTLTSLGILFLAALIAYFITKKVIVVGLRRIIHRIVFQNQDVFKNHSVIRRIANIIPAMVILHGIPAVPNLSEKVVQTFQMFAQAWIFITIAMSISEFLNVLNIIYQRNPKSHNKPIKGYLQLIKLIIYIVCALMILGTFLKKDVLTIFAGFGAMAAVMMLVFQNTILSLVASVQIASYDMIRIGDWIEMPKVNADGEVIDMSLHTITVQNWDKTYTTIPTNRLITDTFKNWRGMTELGRRRIKRALFIDQTTIRFLSDEELKKLRHFLILEQYLDAKTQELNEWNQPVEDILNQRRLTNLGTFRAYVLHYLRHHTQIAQDQTILVRQLEPTSTGLPLEVYAFTTTPNWVKYEDIQSDIFDYLLAIISEFGLRAYQAPSGADLNRWTESRTQQ